MVRRLQFLLFSVGCVALAACAVETSTPSSASGAPQGYLEVASWSATHFDATYVRGQESARIEVEYTASSTRFELHSTCEHSPRAVARAPRAEPPHGAGPLPSTVLW